MKLVFPPITVYQGLVQGLDFLSYTRFELTASSTPFRVVDPTHTGKASAGARLSFA